MGTVTVKINLDKTGYSAGITDTRRQAKQLADSLKAAGADGSNAIVGAQKAAEQLGRSLGQAGAHGVSSMQAASGAIRLLEGGMQGNIRAAERFIGLIPGLSTALMAGFPIVGAIAFGGALVRIGSEVDKFITTAREMPKTISSAFESLSLSAHATNDELNVSNDKIENQIAKLEHKPENNLKLALDEAKVSADQFAKSVETAANAMRELISKNSISMLQGFFADTAPTKALAGTVKPFEDDKEHFATQAAIGRSLGDSGRYDANMKAFHDKEDAELEKMRKVLADAQAKQAAMAGVTRVNQDQTPIMTMAQGIIDQIQLSRAHEAAMGTKDKDDAQLARDQKAAQMAADAKKSQEQLLKVYEDQEKQQNAFNKLSVNEEIAFWSDRIAAFTKGGEQYLQVQNKIYDEIAKRPNLFSENKKNQAEIGKSQVEGNDLMDRAQKALITGPAVEQMERATRANEKYNEMVANGAEAQAKANAAFREASIAIGLQTGTMSKLAAAEGLAQVHADEHAAAIAAVNKELKDQLALINSDTSLKGDDLTRAIRNAKQSSADRTDQLNGAYAVTRQQDTANIYENTGAGAAADTYRNMLQNWSDMTQNIAQAMTKAADSFNDDIAKAITGHGKKSDFAHTFSQLGESLVKASLQKGESALFGGGQLGSSPSNAVWTRNAAMASAGGPGAPNMGPFVRPFFGGQQGGQTDGGGSVWSKLAGAFLPGLHFGGGASTPTDDWGLPSGFQGGFANGGDVLANRPLLLGERGPEMFIPPTAGRIVPNNQLGGGDTHNHFNIDARGATDPAAVHAAVMRAAPSIVAASVQAVHHNAKRSPRGR